MIDNLCSTFLKLSSTKTKLNVFDFDNTLFRSPNKPEGWTGGWWGKPLSLEEPHVPEIPGDEWWISDSVDSAWSCINDPGAHTVMMTGRIPKFQNRIGGLLKSRGLNFDGVFFAGSDSDTITFKKNKLKELINSLLPESVEIWEDRAPHVEEFNILLEGMKNNSLIKEYVVNHVVGGEAP